MTEALPIEERRRQWLLRKRAVAEMMPGVRLHRLEECTAWPLCPGHDVSDTLSGLPYTELIDFALTALGILAEREGELETARIRAEEAERERDRAKAKVAELDSDLDMARREADAGWRAYRSICDRAKERGITDLGQPGSPGAP